MWLKTLPCLSYSVNVSQGKRRKESKEPPRVAEHVLSAATLLKHSCSHQHSWVFGQEKSLSIHLFCSPYGGVSCKNECWKASSASTDTKLHVVSQNHNLLIPAGSWDKQKHAGVKLCKLTLLNYSSVAACAREHSVHITPEGSCGESRWRRGWGSCPCDCSVVSLAGTTARPLLGAAPSLMLRVQEKTHTRSFTSALQLTATQRHEMRDQWMDWDGIKANCFDPFPQLPAAHETALEKCKFTPSKSLGSCTPQLCNSPAPWPNLQRPSWVFCFGLFYVLGFFSEILPLQNFQLNLGHWHNQLLLLALETINQEPFYPTSVTISGIGQHQTSHLESGLLSWHPAQPQRPADRIKAKFGPLCQGQYSHTL